MRQGVGEVAEKGLVFVGANEGEGLFVDFIVRIASAVVALVFGQKELCIIMPEVVGVVKMGVDLVIKAEPFIKPLLERKTRGLFGAQAPLAEAAGNVAHLFQDFSDAQAL